ncbi:DUF6081 family protein [Nocardia sp. BMG51109]|uniref:DUF6081 family protein n=1 Tax=Nocardia sp. BMG51109 TaxID=1056816 RepID=UPI0004646D40|nr:DUF6081 family protein [Nocardia sp. BMG51109]
MTSYDDLSGPTLRDDRWQYLQFPIGDDETWTYAEPDAKTDVGDGAVSVRIDEFTRSHPQVQLLDNPKHLLVSTEEFDLTTGPRTFAVDMTAENIGSTGEDYRDGFAAFNVLDMATADIFDLIVTSRHAYAIHERLYVPGVIDPADAFTHVVHAPLAGISPRPGHHHRYAITLDPARHTVTWRIDDTPVYTAHPATLPGSVRIGFGIITLHPIADGHSTSLRGQGLHGHWRHFDIT